MQPYVSNGQIRLHANQSVLYEQLHYYPEADHDDGPDALQMLWELSHKYSADYSYRPVASDRQQQWHGAGSDPDWPLDDSLAFIRPERFGAR